MIPRPQEKAWRDPISEMKFPAFEPKTGCFHETFASIDTSARRRMSSEFIAYDIRNSLLSSFLCPILELMRKVLTCWENAGSAKLDILSRNNSHDTRACRVLGKCARFKSNM